jgi:hypothetical protein
MDNGLYCRHANWYQVTVFVSVWATSFQPTLISQRDRMDVDQSALTGESLPVSHKEGDLACSGPIIK